MKAIYQSGYFFVAKSPIDGTYSFYADRMPLVHTTPKGALELAEAIIKEEQFNPNSGLINQQSETEGEHEPY